MPVPATLSGLSQKDGTATYYVVQHDHEDGQWCDTDLSHVLFRSLASKREQGALADYYRRLLAAQSASSDLWQRFHVNGFEDLKTANAMLEAVREAHRFERNEAERGIGKPAHPPEVRPMRFRLVERTRSQSTRMAEKVLT